MPSETYSTIKYVGLNGGTRVSGTFVEIDALHWVENGILNSRSFTKMKSASSIFLTRLAI